MKKILIFVFFVLPLNLAMASEVSVFAAASLTEALGQIAKKYESLHQTKIQLTFDASSRLARQIKEGAKAELFFSADKEWSTWLEQEKVVGPQMTKELLTNELVVIAHKSSPFILTDLSKMNELKFKVFCMAFGTVPAGKYGYEALHKAGVYSSLAGKIVHGENIRHVLQWVAKNEADLGIVYKTDALVEPKVKILYVIPSSFHSKIVYSVSLLGKAPRPEAKKFFDYLSSKEAGEIFHRAGFKDDHL